MCGITGLISSGHIAARLIEQMTTLISHRGPDDEGFVLFKPGEGIPVVAGGMDTPVQAYNQSFGYSPGLRMNDFSDMPINIGLGHRRLAIVDLSILGHQPMCTSDQRYWIVYNGEVYNYIELRQELEMLGYNFISHTDTEVILAAYAQWGADCLHRFNGMWAFAIYDIYKQEVFLARDRFGVKPLYYWVAPDGTFCFASEIKQFTAFPGWRAKINPQRTYDFLVWGATDHTDETLFDRVYQIRPGHYVNLPVKCFPVGRDGRVQVRQWYELKYSDFSGSFDDAAAELLNILTDSVRLQLRADVPVGSCLSGGLDSSSIVCIMNRLLQKTGSTNLQKTFSACADVERFDERKWIDEVVRSTNVQAHYVYPSVNELFDNSPLITWHQDEPYGSTSIYAQWNVFRLAAQNGVKVLLDGQGADEQLAGYHNFFASRFTGLMRTGQLIQLWKEIQKMHEYSYMSSCKSMASMFLPPSLKTALQYFSRKEARKFPSWLSISWIDSIKSLNPQNEPIGVTHSMQSFSQTQLTSTSLPALLRYEDRNSMAHSIESRVPFVDYRLIEFVLGLPDDFKLSGGITKRVLRAGVGSLVPDRIRNRTDKLGFVTPEEVWVKERAPEQFRKKMSESIEASEGILNHQCIQYLEDTINGNRSYNFLLWRMISFGEWMNAFSVKR